MTQYTTVPFITYTPLLVLNSTDAEFITQLLNTYQKGYVDTLDIESVSVLHNSISKGKPAYFNYDPVSKEVKIRSSIDTMVPIGRLGYLVDYDTMLFYMRDTFYRRVQFQNALEPLLKDLPENRPIYKDSGLWSVRSEDLETTYAQQGVYETFEEFIKRYAQAEAVLDAQADVKKTTLWTYHQHRSTY